VSNRAKPGAGKKWDGPAGTVIVKVQLPLPLTGTGVDALVYAEGHCFLTKQNIDTTILRALAGESKGYFEASMTAGLWSIGKRVEEQPW